MTADTDRLGVSFSRWILLSWFPLNSFHRRVLVKKWPSTACSNKWSEQFDLRLHLCHTWTVQSYSPGGAKEIPHPVHPNWHLQRTSVAPAESSILSTHVPCRPLLPSILPIHVCGHGPHLIHGSLGHPSPHLKEHLHWCSHFCTAHDRGRQTDRQTDDATPSVTTGRIYIVL